MPNCITIAHPADVAHGNYQIMSLKYDNKPVKECIAAPYPSFGSPVVTPIDSYFNEVRHKVRFYPVLYIYSGIEYGLAQLPMPNILPILRVIDSHRRLPPLEVAALRKGNGAIDETGQLHGRSPNGEWKTAYRTRTATGGAWPSWLPNRAAFG